MKINTYMVKTSWMKQQTFHKINQINSVSLMCHIYPQDFMTR